MEVPDPSDYLNASFNSSEVGPDNYTLYQRDFEQILTDFRRSLYRMDEPVTIVLIVCYIVVFMSALLGNLLVLLVILSNRSMRTSITNSYLLNLAVADLLVTLVCIPLTIGETVYRVWIYSFFLCKATNYIQGLCISASVLTIMALSVDRYLAIRHPVRCRQTPAEPCVRITIVSIWLVSGAIMVPLAVVRSLTWHPLPTGQAVALCAEHWPSPVLTRTAFDIFLLVFIYIVPGTVVVYSYSSTGCTLLTGDQLLVRAGSDGRQADSLVMAGRRRLARMLLVLAILFALSWLPYHAVNLYVDCSTQPAAEQDTSLNVLSFALLLGHSHSAQNPVVYCLMNNSFKRGVRSLLRCRQPVTVSSRTPMRRAAGQSLIRPHDSSANRGHMTLSRLTTTRSANGAKPATLQLSDVTRQQQARSGYVTCDDQRSVCTADDCGHVEQTESDQQTT